MARTDKNKNKPLEKKKKITTDQSKEGMSTSAEPTGRVMSETPTRSTQRSKKQEEQRTEPQPREPQRIERETPADLQQSEAFERVSSSLDAGSTTNGNRGLEDHATTHRRIAERAFILFVESGCEHGNDWLHWFEAERQVKDTQA